MIENDIISLGNTLFKQRDISPAQLGVTSRQINYWIENKVVVFVEKQQSIKGVDDTNLNKTKWVRLDLAQAVWVCIIKELLSSGVSIKNLQDLTYQVWQKPREDKYADMVFTKHIQNKNNALTPETIQKLKSNLSDEPLMKNYFRTFINPFTDLIKSAILKEKFPHSMVYVPATNQHTFLEHGTELIQKIGSAYLEHTMISLPVIPFIAKVITIDLSNTKKDIDYITDVEKQLRDIIYFKKPKMVEIAFENDVFKPIFITEEHKTREQLAHYMLTNKIAKGSKLLIDIRSQDNYKITLIKK
ncbi:MAG: hypothetical protein ABF239_01930 [Wenyingzhuangia sp.]